MSSLIEATKESASSPPHMCSGEDGDGYGEFGRVSCLTNKHVDRARHARYSWFFSAEYNKSNGDPSYRSHGAVVAVNVS